MLTRPRRQAVASLALLAFSVLPTLYVSVTARRLQGGGHLREVEAEIGRRLGVLATIASAEHPRPGVDVLDGVTLKSSEGAGSEIARADRLTLSRESGEWSMRAEGLRIRGEGPAASLGQAVGLIGRFGSSGPERVSLAADECSVLLGDREYRFRDVVAVCGTDRDGASLTASYRPEGGGNRSRCEMALSRSGAITSLSFRTMEGPVSAGLLSPFFDSPGWLGPKATVEGQLSLNRADGAEWRSEFRGELASVDLSRVVGQRFAGRRLTGMARLAVESAKWSERPGEQGPGWVEVRGSLTPGPARSGFHCSSRSKPRCDSA